MVALEDDGTPLLRVQGGAVQRRDLVADVRIRNGLLELVGAAEDLDSRPRRGTRARPQPSMRWSARVPVLRSAEARGWGVGFVDPREDDLFSDRIILLPGKPLLVSKW